MTYSIKYLWGLGIMALLTGAPSCHQQDNAYDVSEQSDHQNRLAHSNSPYLLQHADNPVNWYPWGDKAFQKAKQDSKLVIISIGYSACHWCHVMEHKSFMDSTVAQVMNKNFVSIKVDREQRPDVDDTYMRAAHMTSGRGGWPLNAIALPNGKPIVAGTYFPTEKWIQFLKRTQQMWEKNPQQLRQQAQQVTEGIQRADQIRVQSSRTEFTLSMLDTLWAQWKGQVDFERGGDKGRMKFPKPNNWQYLLRYHYLTDNPKALEAVNVTLRHMAKGGIYDHVGGGFARYSTDQYWKVPHFEKMLYDNAQLMSLYAEAYKVTQDSLYKEVVFGINEFIQRHLQSPEGGFYSSLNADSEGEEGKYYVWTYATLNHLLRDSTFDLVKDYYNVTKSGNWEHGKNILHRTASKQQLAEKHGMTVRQLNQRMTKIRDTLLHYRKKRVLPSKDTKVLTEWNALMLQGYIDAYEAFGEPQFLNTARANAQFLYQQMVTDSFRLYRSYKDGQVAIEGFLDDYSFTIEAFIALYQVTFEEKWLQRARQLMTSVIEHFYDDQKKLFYYASDSNADLITRKIELKDNVIPAANSSIAKGLYRLGQYFYQDLKEYRTIARDMAGYVQPKMKEAPGYFSNWGILLTYFVRSPYEVAIVGPAYRQKATSLYRQFLPTTLLMGSEASSALPLLQNKYVKGETHIYVCQEKVCQRPVTEVRKALKQLKQ